MKTILVIDDIQLYRDLFTRRLIQLGYSVIQADCGEMALDCLQKYPIDLIFLDHWMPGITGLELLEKLKQDLDLVKIPVVMTSSDPNKNEIGMAQYGVLTSIKKPATLAEVRSVLREIAF